LGGRKALPRPHCSADSATHLALRPPALIHPPWPSFWWSILAPARRSVARAACATPLASESAGVGSTPFLADRGPGSCRTSSDYRDVAEAASQSRRYPSGLSCGPMVRSRGIRLDDGHLNVSRAFDSCRWVERRALGCPAFKMMARRRLAPLHGTAASAPPADRSRCPRRIGIPPPPPPVQGVAGPSARTKDAKPGTNHANRPAFACDRRWHSGATSQAGASGERMAQDVLGQAQFPTKCRSCRGGSPSAERSHALAHSESGTCVSPHTACVSPARTRSVLG
jgi:hypothetical protein